jgi:hypothetical protein
MFKTSDGKKKFGSKFVTSRYDSFHPKEQGAEEGKSAGEKMLGEEKEGHEGSAAEQVVAEHGPAHTVHVHHDHEANKHKVMSHHKDGHMHESDHATAMEAHEEGKKLAGADGMEDESKEKPQEGAESEEQDFMPGETV